MKFKTFVKSTLIGFAIIGILLTFFSNILWPCSVTKDCPNGLTIWCETLWCDGEDESCCTGNDYVMCYCSDTTFVLVMCSGTVKGPRAPIN